MVKVDSYNRDTVLYTKFYDSHNLTFRAFSCDYVVTVYELDSVDNIINKYYDVPCWLIDAGCNIDGQLSYDLMLFDVNTGDSVFISDLLDKTHKWVIRGELFDNTEYSADRAFLKFCSF